MSSVSTAISIMNDAEIRESVLEQIDGAAYTGKRVLALVPDATRSGPVAAAFQAAHEAIQPFAAQFDAMVALGTHPAMPQAAIKKLLGIENDPDGKYASVHLLNHAWNDPAALKEIGRLSEDETSELSNGMMRENVPVEINRTAMGYDCLLVVGPVFPHEVAGFSGGNKYYFPGIAGQKVLDFFHWLGALVSNAKTIGVKDTLVRRVINRCAELIPVERRLLAYVAAPKGGAHGVFYGEVEEAWNAAVEVSKQVHIRYVDKPFKSILSCAPAMYDDLWVGGKCMYKLEPVVADGGELIIYAPHITETSVVHGHVIDKLGYHVCEYFAKQWDQFKDYPRGVLAHLTHVRGSGTYENGVEKPRVNVTLATGISPKLCEQICFGYKDPATVNFDNWRDKEDEGILFVEKAGETLYRLKE
jgi:nickel-dependent lactate racemase